MVIKRLIAKGITTRIESRIKNKENRQFNSRVLNKKGITNGILSLWNFTHRAEKMPNA
jgi:hypothetical protein